MNRRIFAYLMASCAVLVLVAATFVSYEALTEAYGSGPPYYSRSTNMDKWYDPLPEVVIGDLLASMLAAAFVWASIRRR